MRSLWRDLRLGWRMLGRSPAFATLAILTLALGIGSTTVIVSFADAAVLNLLNFRDALEIMHVSRTDERGQGRRQVLLTTYAHWRDHTNVFREMAARILRLRSDVGFRRLLAADPMAALRYE